MRAYIDSPDSYMKSSCVVEFLRFSQQLLSDLENKIKKGKDRLLAAQREQATSNGLSLQQQEEIEEKITILSDKIDVLVDQAEHAGCQGDVEEAQCLLKLCDQLKEERECLRQQIGFSGGLSNQFGSPKAMKVCEVCGVLLMVDDAPQRVDDHLMGKMHVGYGKLRSTVNHILDRRKDAGINENKNNKNEVKETSGKNYRREESSKSREKDKFTRHSGNTSYKDQTSRSRDRNFLYNSHTRDHRDRNRQGSRDFRSKRNRSKDRRERQEKRERSFERTLDRHTYRRERSSSRDSRSLRNISGSRQSKYS